MLDHASIFSTKVLINFFWPNEVYHTIDYLSLVKPSREVTFAAPAAANGRVHVGDKLVSLQVNIHKSINYSLLGDENYYTIGL